MTDTLNRGYRCESKNDPRSRTNNLTIEKELEKKFGLDR